MNLASVGTPRHHRHHINLATITHLFEGEILDRDSFGTEQVIRPGEVNWMTARRGIARSERTSTAARAHGGRLSGLQTWVALPVPVEETEPAFAHYSATELAVISDVDKTVYLIAGSLYGATAPVTIFSDIFYARAGLSADARLPIDTDHEGHAIFAVAGEIDIGGQRFEAGGLLVFGPGERICVTAVTAARFRLLGGASIDEPRYIWWNFVSSRRQRIRQAAADRKAERFAKVPADAQQFAPLPDDADIALSP